MSVDDSKIDKLIQELNKKELNLRDQTREISRVMNNLLSVKPITVIDNTERDPAKRKKVTIPIDNRTGKEFIDQERQKVYDANVKTAEELIAQ